MLYGLPPPVVLVLGTSILLMLVFPQEACGVAAAASKRFADYALARVAPLLEFWMIYHVMQILQKAWAEQVDSVRRERLRQEDLQRAVLALLASSDDLR